MFEQVTILGPGLLGASLAMAMKERQLARRVIAWSRRPETRDKSARQVWCDAVHDTAEEAVAGSDLVVICTPVQTIVPLLKQIDGHLSPDALVTDVGSTKSLICHQSQDVLTGGAAFIGSHPMAGSEQTGMDFASAELFDDAACILTPLADTPEAVRGRIHELWKALGMAVSVMSPEQHDEVVAHISHLPHLLASSLCGYLAQKDHSWSKLSGGGLRDTTRVASGDPGLWRQILEQNREEVLRAIDGLEKQLLQFKSALLNKDSNTTLSLLERGKKYRDDLNK